MTVNEPYTAARVLNKLVEADAEDLCKSENRSGFRNSDDDVKYDGDDMEESVTDDSSSFDVDSSFDDDETSSCDDEAELEDYIEPIMSTLETKRKVYVSLEMADKLNLSRSARDLFTRPAQAPMVLERSQSFYHMRPVMMDPLSSIVYAIQTESPIAAPAGVTMDRGDCVSPLQLLRSIVMEHDNASPSLLGSISYDTVSTWVPGDVDAYSLELMTAVRRNDLAAIQSLHHASIQNKTTLQCANRFGESIVHAVARRGSVEILSYMVEQANVSMHVCCDQGRTILHDAAWSTTPNFDCIRYILTHHPEFLWIADKRQFVPLDYAPRSSWTAWNGFLSSHQHLLQIPPTLLPSSPPPSPSSSPLPTTSATSLSAVSSWLFGGL